MPGRRYAIDGDQTITTPADSALGLTSVATTRPEVYYVCVGIEGTPADNTFVYNIQRYTAAGAGTTVTPTSIDPGDPASLCTGCLENHTTEPTYTAALILWRLGLNARASHSWWADAYGALKSPATAANGVGLYTVHASATPDFSATFHFAE